MAMSQAPGLSGTPDSGHCSSAATRASCARSSARPTSPTIRARPAMTLADSIRQTASIACWASDISRLREEWLLLRGRLSAQALLGCAELARGVARSEILGFEYPADLDLRLVEGGALEPLDRLVQ